MPAAKKTVAEKPEETVEETVKTVEKNENTGEEETIVVKKKDLEAFMGRLETLESENKRLFAVADKGRLAAQAELDAKTGVQALIHTVRLTRIGSMNGPLVIAWKILDNDSYMEGNKMIEKQNIQVVYEDGKTENMRLIDFYRKQNKQTTAEIVRRSKNEETGETMLTVRMRDGKEFELSAVFVN